MTSSRIEGPASLRPTICASPDRSRPALTGGVFFACWALRTDGHDLDHASRLRGDRVDPTEGLDRLGADDDEGYLVTLDQLALDRLRARRRRGESYSDAILRLARG